MDGAQAETMVLDTPRQWRNAVAMGMVLKELCKMPRDESVSFSDILVYANPHIMATMSRLDRIESDDFFMDAEGLAMLCLQDMGVPVYG